MSTKHWMMMSIGVVTVIGGAAAIAASVPKIRSVGGDAGAEAVFREARAYTVRIQTRVETPFIEDGRGSASGAGFLVDAERRWIVTNAHVVGQSPSKVEVAFADEPFQPARKVYVDTFADVAVLAVDTVPKGRTPPKLGRDGDVRIGEPIGVFGHPLDMYFTGTRGIISNKTDQDGPDLLQIDASVDHGNSGGPVISLMDGHVVGIATAGVMGDKSDRLNFATPMEDVCRILALLREGVSPSPPRTEFAFLKDQDGRQTMIVARSFNPQCWPLQPQDRIIAVGGRDGEVETLTDFVSALRGRTGRVPLTVERAGCQLRVDVAPTPRPLTVARRGVVVDGALLAPTVYDDAAVLHQVWGLVVQSVEPGSATEMLGIERGDILQFVDGRAFADVDTLATFLRHHEGRPIRIVFVRWSPSNLRILDYHARELPCEKVQVVGDEPTRVASRQE
jgi:S1-C subfamily serine protease